MGVLSEIKAQVQVNAHRALCGQVFRDHTISFSNPAMRAVANSNYNGGGGFLRFSREVLKNLSICSYPSLRTMIQRNSKISKLVKKKIFLKFRFYTSSGRIKSDHQKQCCSSILLPRESSRFFFLKITS